MFDIKAWLEQAGEPVEETAFPTGEAPPYPYIIFLDSCSRGGADMKNMQNTHALTVERYSDTSEYNTELEALLDAQAIEYKREQQWLSSEGGYMTTYIFTLYERQVF